MDWDGHPCDDVIHDVSDQFHYDALGRLDRAWNEQGTVLATTRINESEEIPGDPPVASISKAVHALTVTGVPEGEASSVTFEHTHTFDPNGRVLRVVGPGYTIGYRYDAVGRCTRIGVMNGQTWAAYVDYVPGPTGQIESAAYSSSFAANVTITDFLRDRLLRLHRIHTTNVSEPNAVTLFDATYGYAEEHSGSSLSTDARNLVTSIQYASSETYNPIDSRTYWYDANRRLAGASYTSAGTTDYEYEYTLTGEPRRLKSPSDSGVNVSWANSRPTQVGSLEVAVAPSGSIGRIGTTQDPLYAFQRDRRNQISAITGQCIYNDVRYSPLGLRVRYDDEDGTHLEFDDRVALVDAAADGTIRRVYVYAPDGYTPVIILQSEGSQLTPYFVHVDQVGAPQFVTDVGGTIVWKARYEPYGTFVAGSEDRDPDGDAIEFEQPIRFPGQFAISGDGCNVSYNKHRYYLAKYGMYDTLDQWYWDIQHQSELLEVVRYSYAASNPVLYIDPYGLFVNEKFGCKSFCGTQAVRDVQRKSEEECREYYGYIYCHDDGTFSYDEPTPQFEDSVNLIESIPGTCGWYHTHGCYQPKYGLGNFGMSDEDKDVSDETGLDGYLGGTSHPDCGPDGPIWHYDPKLPRGGGNPKTLFWP